MILIVENLHAVMDSILAIVVPHLRIGGKKKVD